MDDQVASAAKARLDDQLKTVGPNVGIAFGLDLFDAFRSRGWIKLETGSILGTGFMAIKLPAYGKTHYAFSTWDIPEDGFFVGSDK